jgi:hypothetical protein
VKTWSFGQIGHGPKLMRNDFPASEIEWYPDATGNEILAGYKQEIAEARIQLRTSKVNPHVVDRIFVINKLFEMGLLHLFPELSELAMALKVRQYNEAGEPVKRQGENDPSHYCDGLEYVIWKIVAWDPDFADIYQTTLMGRAAQKKKPTLKAVQVFSLPGSRAIFNLPNPGEGEIR